MSNYTFFGVQTAYRQYRGDMSRSQLHGIISRGTQEQSLPEKRGFWKRIVGIVGDHVPHFEYGSWDLIRGDKAEAEFETWSSEIEGGIATEAEEMGGEVDEASRLSTQISDTRLVVVSALFLVDAGSNSDDTLGERCDLPEAAYFKRATFDRLWKTIPLLNFANVRADAVYVVPGNERDGLAELEIREHWSHLKPVERD